jgi:hypothetical protein
MKVAPALVFTLLGCNSRFLEEDLDGTRHLWTRLNSNNAGTAHIKVPVQDGETSMLATVRVDPPYQVHFRTVNQPDGTEVFRAFEWNDSAYSKTNGGFIAEVSTLNWPVQAEDAELYGGRWELEFGVVDSAQEYVGAPVFLDVVLKRDDAFSRGALEVSIVFTDGLENDQELRDAVDAAREIWRELYAAMGVDLSFHIYAFPDGELGPPAYGDEPAYSEIAEDTTPRSVNLVISSTIQGIDQVLGIAGDIPGPIVPSPRSGVQISALEAPGTDGTFEPEDIRILAETMAHEVGHYLGLFHPVERGWEAWDVLPDTPECDIEAGCIDALGANLMFPNPVCGPALCLPQDVTTEEQAGVINRNSHVD